MKVKELLLKQASLSPARSAIIFKDKKTNFSQLRDASFKLANYLINSGLNKSDKVAVFLPNIPEAVFSYLGVFSMGGILVPLDFMLSEEEVINLINHSEAKVLVSQYKKEVDLVRVQKSCPTLKDIILCREKIDGFSFWDDVLRKGNPQEPRVEIEEISLSSIFYTSGSTGRPKGVVLTYKHFDSPIRCVDYYLRLSSKDVVLCGGLPLSHIAGFDFILLVLYFGSTLILMERFLPLELLKNIQEYKVTLIWLVPSMYVAILSLKKYDIFDLSSLKYLVVFGAPSSPVLLKRFHKICSNSYLLNGWGMTETSAPNCVLPPGLTRIESIGKFSPGMEAKVVDEEGNALKQGKEGELWVKGDAVMLGYYKEPELTKEVLREDGWFKTGDIAKFDRKGLLYIVGRKKDMIKVAGEVVFSPEVEGVIHRHPKVKEVAVIGVPDRLRGEVPKAFIVPKQEEYIDTEELKEFLRKHLAHFKIPHYLELVKELPKTRSGKIDKSQLAYSK